MSPAAAVRRARRARVAAFASAPCYLFADRVGSTVRITGSTGRGVTWPAC